MFVFPIGELMDEGACLQWLEQHLHPEGLRCPRCASTNRRDFRPYQAFPSYRCRDGQRPSTVVTGTAFEKTRQQPSTVVLLLRGITQGVSTSQLAEELEMSRRQTHTLRQRLQDNANETAPQSQMEGIHFESDEGYQNAGEKKRRPYRPRRPAATAWQ
ncbi:transposase [Candidatus Oscillochloris fontis]|uniref:transposase n=1 Tax=Candidatus Oscillochloris fontis TaxID=2496868 RepID=UPI0013755C79|nr:transposase [Candidatus Oscillochloris fontis]